MNCNLSDERTLEQFWKAISKADSNARTNTKQVNHHPVEDDNDFNCNIIEDNIPVEMKGCLYNHVPIENFEDIYEFLPEFLKENIEKLHFKKPTPIQKHSLKFSLSGIDLCCCSQTGSGKTLAYLIPLIASLCKPKDYIRDCRKQRKDDMREEKASNDKSIITPTKNPISKMNTVSPPEVLSIYKIIEEKGRFITRINLDKVRGVMPFGLIVLPTRELTQQIHQQIRKLIGGTNIRVVSVHGGDGTLAKQLSELTYGCDILIGTAGRLEHLFKSGIVSIEEIRFIVIDEVDRMVDTMGFGDYITRLIAALKPKEDRQILCFTATITQQIKQLILDFLDDHILLSIGGLEDLPRNVKQNLLLVSSSFDHKMSLLLETIKLITDGKTLIFVRRKKHCSNVKIVLNDNDILADELHGDMSQDQRERSLKNFRDGIANVLVATDVAARGIDICDIAHVIQFDLPISPNEFSTFIHRIGRTGRAGRTGLATSFYVSGRVHDHNNCMVGNGRIAPQLKKLFHQCGEKLPIWFENSPDLKIALENMSPEENEQRVKKSHRATRLPFDINSNYRGQDGTGFSSNHIFSDSIFYQSSFNPVQHQMNQQLLQQHMIQQQILQQQMMIQSYYSQQQQLHTLGQSGHPFAQNTAFPFAQNLAQQIPMISPQIFPNIYTQPFYDFQSMNSNNLMMHNLMMQYQSQPMAYTVPVQANKNTSSNIQNNTGRRTQVIKKTVTKTESVQVDVTDASSKSSSSSSLTTAKIQENEIGKLKSESLESEESHESIEINTTTTITTVTDVDNLDDVKDAEKKS